MAPADWHPRLVLLSVAANEDIKSQATKYRRDVESNLFGLSDICSRSSRPEATLSPVPSRNRSCPTRHAGVLRIDLALTLAAIPGNSETLIPNSVRRRSTIHSRGSEPACAVLVPSALADDWRYRRSQVIRSLGRKERRPEDTRCRLFISKPNHTMTL